MSKTAIFFLLFYFGCLFGAFFKPILGVWGFVFESCYHPPLQYWRASVSSFGDRWSLMIGAAMLVATLIHWGSLNKSPLSNHIQTWLLGLYAANSFLVTSWAYTYEHSYRRANDMLNWFIVYVCIVKTNSEPRLRRVVLYIYIFAAANWGWDLTWDPKGGRDVNFGPTTARTDNFVSAHVVALLPLTALLVASPGTDTRLRWAMAAGVPFMFNIVAHASSRGAMLAAAGAGICLLLLPRGKIRVRMLLAMIAGSLLVARLMHQQFWERFFGIQTYTQDGSAMGRVDAWKAAWVLIQRNPFGYGAEAFDSGLGAALMRENFHTTHNMFFELLMAWGVQGTILLFGFIFVSMWDCFRITRRFYDAKKWPPSAEYLEAMGVLIGFVAMLIAALFLNRMMWELWYVFGAYTCSLKNSIAQLPGGPQKPLEHSARAAMAPWDFRTGTAEFWPGPARTSQPVARGTPDIPR